MRKSKERDSCLRWAVVTALPDGEYLAETRRVWLQRNDFGQAAFLWLCEVTRGAYVGETIMWRETLTRENLPKLKAMFSRYGCNNCSLKEIASALSLLTGCQVGINLITVGQMQIVELSKALNAPDIIREVLALNQAVELPV